MGELQYRALKPDELRTICSFPQSRDELFYVSPSADYPLQPEQLWSIAQSRHFPTVVVDADASEVVGYANLYDWNAESGTVWLGNVIVSPVHRGSGVADYLLQTMMDQAAAGLGALRMKLYCHNSNTRALLFYIGHGFAPNGGSRIVDHPNGGKIVSIEMEKQLRRG